MNKWEGLNSQVVQNLSVYSNQQQQNSGTSKESSISYSQSRQQQSPPMKPNRSGAHDFELSPTQRPRRTAPNPPTSVPPRASMDTGGSPRQARQPLPAQKVM